MAGTTGKIAGRVTDATTGEPLIGAQVYIEATQQGAVTDIDGYYAVLNVKPGTYVVRVSYTGYATQLLQDVPVVVDQTFTLDVQLGEEVIEGEEVIVTAERPLVQMDRTTTTAFVDEQQIQALPVTNLDEIVELQAGVVDGHFRGGRAGEVMYMVNGIPINNPYDNGQGFTIEKNMVSGLEVISGVFNAEYGQAMSGVVNIITKDAPTEWSGEVQAEVGGTASNRQLLFVNRTVEAGSNLPYSAFETESVGYSEAAGLYDRQDVQLSLGGPLWKDKLGLRLTGRYVYDESDDISRRLFMPSDSSANMGNNDTGTWRIESTGDGAFVQGWSRVYSFNSALVYAFSPRVKLDYNAFLEIGEGRDNDFGRLYTRKYVPEGLNNQHHANQLHVASLRATLGTSAFANISYGFLQDDWASRLHDIPDGFNAATDVLNEGYAPPENGVVSGKAFITGGNELFNESRRTRTHTVQADYTNQINRVHQIKVGASSRLHSLDNGRYEIEVSSRTNYQAMAAPPAEYWRQDSLRARPYEFSAYLQDKMEFSGLILNAGLRFDYFNSDSEIPIDWAQAGLDSVANVPGWRYYDASRPATIRNRQQAPARHQVSPRLGVAFPISETGVVRFSAGLFFQVPPLQLVFRNPNFEVNPQAADIRYGNAAINPEQTMHFEVALQQGLTDDLGLELTVFSKDFRNLTSELFYYDYNQQKSVRQFINNDVGSSRGITLALSQRPVGPLSWNLDYTLQFAEGSASDPQEAFQRWASGAEDIRVLQRLGWDRRHVLNNRITYAPSPRVMVTMINRWQTGAPYTSVRNFAPSFIKNNLDSPSSFLSDLRLYITPPFMPSGFQITAQVDNLFDAQVHNPVFASTGRADESFELELDRRSEVLSGVNGLDEFYLSPYRLGGPRSISLGARFAF